MIVSIDEFIKKYENAVEIPEEIIEASVMYQIDQENEAWMPNENETYPASILFKKLFPSRFESIRQYYCEKCNIITVLSIDGVTKYYEVDNGKNL